MSVEPEVSRAIIRLMQGVVYRETDEDVWGTLERSIGAIRDHFSDIGVDVVVADAEGFGYLRSSTEEGDGELPRLVRRRSLTYNVSLLLVLLRKRLAEFEALSADSKLVLTSEQIVDLLRTFQAETSNEARITDQAERTIKQVAELGFLRALRGQDGHWEVQRVLKAFVDTETLADFEAKLRQYAGVEE